jgi:hypothetical protein
MPNLFELGPQYFPMSSIGTPVGAGSLYVGNVDTDPTIVGNQKTVKALKEDDTLIALSQPITLSAGGIPLYNGSPVSLYISGNYSSTVLDINGAQVYYVPSRYRITSEDSLTPGAYYYPDHDEADHGITGNEETVKFYVDLIGATNKATIYFRHNSGNEFTDYVFLTSEAGTDNIFFEFEPGARVKPAIGISFTSYAPENINALPVQQIKTGAGTFLFTTPGLAYGEWVGATGDGATNDTTALAEIFASGAGEIELQIDLIYLTTGLTIPIANFVLNLNYGTLKLTGAGVLITIDNANSLTKDAVIKNGRLEAGALGSGTGIYIEDTSRVELINLHVDKFAKGIHLATNDFWVESTLFQSVNMRANDIGIYFEKAGASASFAQTRFDGVFIATALANAVTPYAMYVDTDASLWRSSFGLVVLWAGKDNSILFYCDGALNSINGILGLERSSGDNIVGMHFDTNASLIRGDLLIKANSKSFSDNGDFITVTPDLVLTGLYLNQWGNILKKEGVRTDLLECLSIYPDITFDFVDGDVTVGTDNIEEVDHGLKLGEYVELTTTGVLPAGLALLTGYYAIIVDDDNFKLAANFNDAAAGTAVDITGAAGGGTHTVTSSWTEGPGRHFQIRSTINEVAQIKALTANPLEFKDIITNDILPILARFCLSQQTEDSDDATPSVINANFLRVINPNATVILDFDDPSPSQVLVVVYLDGGNTTVDHDGGKIVMYDGADFVSDTNATQIFVYDGVSSVWREIARLDPSP